MLGHGTITFRELGATLAVLALYVLVLLAPLHQAAGLQRDLAGLGYETISAWSVCESLASAESDDPLAATAVKCPAAGLSKPTFAAPPSPGLPAAIAQTTGVAAPRWSEAPHRWRLPPHVGQSRAPPVPV
ncbi:MAG: hypothetical protein KIS86_16860 [Devosia sp.]|nr:hypothetical protein [Devosia sp.]